MSWEGGKVIEDDWDGTSRIICSMLFEGGPTSTVFETVKATLVEGRDPSAKAVLGITMCTTKASQVISGAGCTGGAL